jgi:hypothetical protein
MLVLAYPCNNIVRKELILVGLTVGRSAAYTPVQVVDFQGVHRASNRDDASSLYSHDENYVEFMPKGRSPYEGVIHFR